jgi:acyl-CoA synthetase (AMP-forming)/AMP-acid ligase II
MVPFGTGFIVGLLGVLRAGASAVLIDPGMGKMNVLKCLSEVQPDGMIAIPLAQGMRILCRNRFRRAKWNVTLGRKLGWGGRTWKDLLNQGRQSLAETSAEDFQVECGESTEAAIIFTSGSTGPPKGVLYTHGQFQHQIDLIQRQYAIEPGTRDLACFPLFALFDSVMGVTSVIPWMDATRPAQIDPQSVYDAVERWQVTQAFGSPALWNTVVGNALGEGRKLQGMKRVLSAGAPVPPRVLQGLHQVLGDQTLVHTPYGATEALPIATIDSRTILTETAVRTSGGAGTCVGHRFPSIDWQIIEISDKPLPNFSDALTLPMGEIGELMVTGPSVTKQYVTRQEQNELHKVREGNRVWHRMGDVGYLDEQGRFWYCGRKSQRVVTEGGTLFTEPCEGIMNAHRAVARSALVGLGNRPCQKAVMIVELLDETIEMPLGLAGRIRGQRFPAGLIEEFKEWLQQYPATASIEDVRIYPGSLPVDIRHNSKIFRERLAVWARLSSR